MNEWKPFVSVIVPIRNSQAHIAKLLETLLAQKYEPGYEIVLVGNIDDQTWQHPSVQVERQPVGSVYFDEQTQRWRKLESATQVEEREILSHEINLVPVGDTSQWENHVLLDPRLKFYEVDYPEEEKPWFGRDTNYKRNYGALVARGEVLFYTDGKIRHEPNWIAQAVSILAREQVESVAGIMLATEESAQTFWGVFTDNALVKRNPDFGRGYRLNRDNFGKRESLPITACWAMTQTAYTRMDKGFPIDFRDSYEDYATAWEMVKVGVDIFVTNEWRVLHKHRQGFRPILLEYARSARGAAQMFTAYPDSPFAIRRDWQVNQVMRALTVGSGLSIGVLVGDVFSPLVIWPYLAVACVMVFMALVLLGGLNIIKIIHTERRFYPRAIIFPVLTLIFIAWFAFSFKLKISEGGGKPKSNRWLQTMWSFVTRTVR